MLSPKNTKRNLLKTGVVLLFIAILSISSNANILQQRNVLQQAQVVLAQAEGSTNLYLPITTNNFYDPYVLRSPFSVEIAALHEIVPISGKTTTTNGMTEAELLAWYDAAFPTLLEALIASGATNTRVEIKWSQIEPNAPAGDGTPTYDWTWYDGRFKSISDSGIQMLGTVMATNSWAANPSCGVLYPDRMDEFTRFLTDLVNRYKNPPYNVKFWEIINEPDYTKTDGESKGLGCWGNDGADYAQMLQVASTTIKSIDPRATVIQGGVAHDFFTEPPVLGNFNRYFLDDVMAAGGGNYIDALNFHYFHDFEAEWIRWDPNSPDRIFGWLPAPTCGDVFDGQGDPYDAGGIDVIAKASHIQNRMKTCFGVDKPIWLTETARRSADADPGTLDDQARYVPQVYARALSYGIPSITWFALTTPNHPDGQGLLLDDFTPKPAYYAYQTVTTELMGFKYSRALAAPNIEGYYFAKPSAGLEKLLAWGSGTLALTGANQVRVVNYVGSESVITDGQPGDMDNIVNGSVSVAISIDPLYLQVIP
jgi:hypothetical protein